MKPEPRPKRGIRLSDAEWKTFCEEMGPEWLRLQIAEVQFTKKQATSNAKVQ